MRKTLIAAALFSAFAVPGLALAEDAPKADAPPPPPYTLTGNFTLASEYIYRGIAQTNRKPAIQGGIDFVHSSGLYVGTWASNISWLSDLGGVSAPIEMDFYGGYKGTAGDFSYDMGVLQYYYPGTYPDGFVSPNTTELYVQGGWKWFTLKYSHALTDLFGATSPTDATQKASSSGSGYVDLTYTSDAVAGGLTFTGHVGHQKVKGAMGADGTSADYTDWKLGATYQNNDVLSGLAFGLAYVGTNAKGDVGQFYRNAYNKDLGSGRIVFTVGKTL